MVAQQAAPASTDTNVLNNRMGPQTITIEDGSGTQLLRPSLSMMKAVSRRILLFSRTKAQHIAATQRRSVELSTTRVPRLVSHKGFCAAQLDSGAKGHRGYGCQLVPVRQ